jgi:predicted phage replisome organizer
MSDTKTYYYIKLKDSYFDQDKIQVLEALPNGYIYSLILIKLYVKSSKYNGQLKMTSTIPYDPENIDILASVIRHDPDHVKEAIRAAQKLDIITILEGKELWINDMQTMIGKSSTEADRIRKYRAELKNGVQMYNKCTPELEIDIEKKTEIEQNTVWKDRFNTFWKSYPKRVGKGAAEKSFKKINPGKETLNQMLEAIEKAKKSDQWKKDGGQFIPNPATWLNQKRWEDELEIEVDDNRVTLWDGSARVPRYLCVKTERGWEEKSRIGEPSHLKGE